MTQIKYFIKMHYLKNSNSSWLSLCSNIGMVHMFDYILATLNPYTFEWYMDLSKKEMLKKKYDFSERTIYNHLTELKKIKLIASESRGKYIVNTKYVSFGK